MYLVKVVLVNNSVMSESLMRHKGGGSKIEFSTYSIPSHFVIYLSFLSLQLGLALCR